jgi:hypothetical protein
MPAEMKSVEGSSLYALHLGGGISGQDGKRR